MESWAHVAAIPGTTTFTAASAAFTLHQEVTLRKWVMLLRTAFMASGKISLNNGFPCWMPVVVTSGQRQSQQPPCITTMSKTPHLSQLAVTGQVPPEGLLVLLRVDRSTVTATMMAELALRSASGLAVSRMTGSAPVLMHVAQTWGTTFKSSRP